MESGSARVMAALGCLAIVWIATFWLYEPGGRDAQGLAPLPQVAETPLPAARSEGTRHLPAPAGPIVSPPAQTPAPQPAPQAAPANPAPKTPTNPPAKPSAGGTVIPPQFEDYLVKPGETFETIAKTRFGSSKLWSVIAQANPMKDPKRLKPGDQIRLPKDPTNIQGKPAPAGTPTSPTAPGGPNTPAGTPEQAMTEYVVRDGDTLSGIAKSLWGSSKDWKKILDANRAALPSEDKLRPGMKLRIPPKPAD